MTKPVFEFVKSSHSSSGGECVEVALNVHGTVAVRDSKVPDDATLQVPSPAWTVFVGSIGS